MNYSDYSVKISNEPSYYGSTCTQQDADRICGALRTLIMGEFPGIQVDIYNESVINERSSSTFGSDQEVVEQINEWIENNWTAAL
jgi:hypothetical protein